MASLRFSTTEDKRNIASEAAKKEAKDAILALKGRVRKVFDEIGGPDTEALESHQLVKALCISLEYADSDELSAQDATEYLYSALLHDGKSPVSVDQFAGYFRRFEPWAKQRKLLRDSWVDLRAPSLVLEGSESDDLVVIAACQHCAALEQVTLKNGNIHNSTLSTLAQRTTSKLTLLDLTGTSGFGDLGLKALAHYCLQLKTLRVAGCGVSDEGLMPIIKCCTNLTEVEISADNDKVRAALTSAHEQCNVTCVLASPSET